MLYTFTGGPLHGQTRDIQDKDLEYGQFKHVEWGEYSSPFALLPSMTVHPYTPVGDQMIWVEPDKIIK